MKTETSKTHFLSRKTRTVLMFNIPAYTILLVFTVFPMIYCFYVSLQKYDLTRPPTMFIGLGNYQNLLTHSIFWTSLGNTLVFTFSSLLLMFLTSLGLALLLNEPLRGVSKLRALIVTPWAIPPIVTGIAWAWIFDAKYGIANYLLSSFGLTPFLWLSSPTLAMFSVVFARSWHEITFGTLMLLAGLQSIPPDLYEAAKVDGANAWQSFWRITVPLMIPTFGIVSIMTILGAMQIYDIIVSTTGGGPAYHTEVPITRILAAMRGNLQFGYACAMGLVFGAILLSVSLIIIKLSRKLNPLAG